MLGCLGIMKVTIENMTKKYGPVTAVHDLNLAIGDGALHFLLGPSGCGKTTTLRILAGLESPTSGRILFGDTDVTQRPAAQRGIGMVFQNYALWPHMTVRENIEYGLKLKRLTKNEINDQLRSALDLTQLTKFIDRYPGQLSGGQQQRVALARALAIRPSVLLLDEPLSNLDAKLRHEMRDNITRIHRQTKITTIYVTHDQKEALSMGTEVSVMRAGHLIQSETPRRLYHHPKNAFIAGFIGETNLFSGTLVKKGTDFVELKTSFGILKATGHLSSEVKVGEPVTCSIRPETIGVQFGNFSRLHFGGVKVSGNEFESSLVSLTYHGESEQLELEGPEKTNLKVNVFNPPEFDLQAGDRVVCYFPPESICVLPHAADLSSGT